MPTIKEDLLFWAAELVDRGLTWGTGGNLSAFLEHEKEMIITPTGLPLNKLTQEDLVTMDLQGNVRSGHRKPSTEWAMHAVFYARRPEVRAVVHSHPLNATAFSCLGIALPPFHYRVAIIGECVPLASYATFGSTALAENAFRSIGVNKAVILANHGVLSVGHSLEHAFSIAEEVEHLAKLYILAASAGKPGMIAQKEMMRLKSLMSEYGK